MGNEIWGLLKPGANKRGVMEGITSQTVGYAIGLATTRVDNQSSSDFEVKWMFLTVIFFIRGKMKSNLGHISRLNLIFSHYTMKF